MVDWKIQIREAARTAGHVLDDDVIEELEGHAKSAFQAALAEGCGIEEAGRSVSAVVDGWIREADGLRRRPHRPVWVETPKSKSRAAGLLNDVKFAIRILLRQPSFSILATLTMALGIGVMTTLFSVAYGVEPATGRVGTNVDGKRRRLGR